MRRSPAVLTLAVLAAAVCLSLGVPEALAKSPFGIATPDGGGGFGGPLGPFFAWIAVHQAAFYKSLTAHLTAIKENGAAVWFLLGVAFVYGVFHAAGPGHGKAVITSYLVSSGETVRRGVAISFAAALVQACSAVIVVGIGTLIIGMTAQTMTGMTDWLEVGSYAAIAVVGAWLLWSKTFGGGHHHHHHHFVGGHHDHDHGHRGHGHDHHGHGDHDHGDRDHEDCEHHDHDHAHLHGHAGGHDHTAVAAAVAARPPVRPVKASPPSGNPLVRAWSAILAVGVRPCSGAIILLVFAVSQGLIAAGVAATFVMALGTGLTVAALAVLAVSARGLALRFAGADSGAGLVIHRAVEIGGAALVFLFGLSLLGGALYPMLTG